MMVRLLVRYALLTVTVILLNFLLPRLLPGDPLSFGSGSDMNSAVPLSASAHAQLRAYYHLDEPGMEQFVSYLGDLSHGDLGWAISRPEPVSQLVLDRLPWTIGLVLTSLVISASLGTVLGIVAGWSPERVRGRLLVSVMAAIGAIPDFLIAIGLLLVFAVRLGMFPLMGGQSAFAEYGGGTVGIARAALDIMWHLALPATALVLGGVAAFMLIARDTTAGIRREAWMSVARSKGLHERQIALTHALPNVASPLLTFFGLRLGAVFGGVLVVERVFNVPGLGLLAYQSIQSRDYPVLQALFLLSSLGVLAANLAVELVYIRLERRRGLIRG